MAKWSKPSTQTQTSVEFLVDPNWKVVKTVTLDSTAVDSGNTQRTSILRKALCLGKITASSDYAQYSDAASDGTQVMTGILMEEVDLFDDTGVAADSTGLMLVVGIVDNGKLTGIDANGRTDMNAPASGKLIVFDNV